MLRLPGTPATYTAIQCNYSEQSGLPGTAVGGSDSLPLPLAASPAQCRTESAPLEPLQHSAVRRTAGCADRPGRLAGRACEGHVC